MMIVMQETETPGEIEAVVTETERAGALAAMRLAARTATDA
jgi:hypothetical protein